MKSYTQEQLKASGANALDALSANVISVEVHGGKEGAVVLHTEGTLTTHGAEKLAKALATYIHQAVHHELERATIDHQVREVQAGYFDKHTKKSFYEEGM